MSAAWITEQDALDDLSDLMLRDALSESAVRLALSAGAAFKDSAEVWIAVGNVLQLASVDTTVTVSPRTCYERAIEIDPQNAQAWTELGIWLDVFQDDSDGAMTALRKAVMLGAPPDAFAGLARLLSESGDRDAAFAMLDEGFAMHGEAKCLVKYRSEIEAGKWDPL